MKISPYKGIFHSYVDVAWKGTDLTLSVAVTPEYTGKQSFTLEYVCNKEKRTVEMRENTVIGDAHVLSGTIPHEHFDNAEVLDYSINDGIFTLFDHGLRMIEACPLPPVIITEVYSRPLRGKKHTKFLELTNTSDSPVDLYNIKAERFCSGKTTASFLACEPGVNILEGKETAVVRFLTSESFDDDGNIIESHEDYLKGIYLENPYKSTEYKPAKVLDVDTTAVNPQTGLRERDPKAFMLDKDQKPTCIRLSHRDGDKSCDFAIKLNRSCEEIDVLNARSALFSVNPLDGHEGKNVRRNVDATPGVLDERVPIPNFKDGIVPVIIVRSPKTMHLHSDGEMTVEYSVYGNCSDTFMELFLPEGNKTVYPEKNGDIYSVTIPKDTVLSLKELKCCFTVDNGQFCAYYGRRKHYISFTISDNAGPSVGMISPRPDFAYDGERRPLITGELYDASGVNIDRCELFVDESNITDSVAWKGYVFSYKPQKDLAYGDHKLKIKAYDMMGNISVSTVRFSVARYEDMKLYKGEVHTHTAESDGLGTPREAMLNARDVAGMDFFAVTEHSTYLIDDKYKNQIRIANEFNVPGKFAALYGWEMTWAHANGLWGHMNILGCRDVILDRDAYSLGMFYDWMKEHGGVAMFNHPGYSWGNFDEYRIPADVANRNAALAEIKMSGYDREYAHMLKRGYRVSPVYNEDNHSGTWGIASDSFGYVLAPALTRENIMDAFRKRRTYSTSDKTLKLKYSVNGKWMGSEIDYTDTLEVRVELSTELLTGIGRIQLVSVNGIVVAEVNAGLKKEFLWEICVPADYPYYYIKIAGKDRYTVTSPVWIKQNEAIKLEGISLLSSYDEEHPIVCKLTLGNTTEETLKNVKADLYLSPLSGVTKDDVPYVTVYCGKLKAGEKTDVSRKLPVVPGNRALTLVVSAEGKSQKYFDCDCVFLSQLQIAEVLPSSYPCTLKNDDGEDYTVNNPFPYVKLYNSSNSDISLSETSLRLWNTAGKAPKDNQIFSLEGHTVRAGEVFVVWRRRDEKLTADDFNARYGTSFVEGENLIITDKAITKGDAGYKRIDLQHRGEIVSRVEYNYCLESLENEIEEGKAFNYAYYPNFTGTSVKLADYTKPNTGAVYEEQTAKSIIGGAKSKELKAEKNAAKAKEKEDGSSALKVSLPTLGGVAAAGATVGTVVGALLKATKKPSPSEQAKADARLIKKTGDAVRRKTTDAEVKLQKQSEARMVKAIAKSIDKTLDKKYSDKNTALIDDRIKSDKESIKSAQKNLKVLKMQKKAEKALAKREAEIKKEQNK